MKQITNMRKAVCIMANELKKAGYSLSEAFRVKLSMTVKARGTSFGNRQECLGCYPIFTPISTPNRRNIHINKDGD